MTMGSVETTSSEERPFFKSPFFWAFIIGAVLITVFRPLAESFQTAPPPIQKLQPWSLTDHNGHAFGSEQLKGKVWAADFFFTRCPSICTELTKNMKRLTEAMERHGDFRFVSFTVDPDHDTPDVLAAYAQKHGADTDRWTFVTGTKKDLVDLIVGQMKFHVGDKEPIGDLSQADLYDISHTAKFALFDQNGDLRALFSADDEGMAALSSAARLLEKKGPNP